MIWLAAFVVASALSALDALLLGIATDADMKLSTLSRTNKLVQERE
jgi:hypothetical protein